MQFLQEQKTALRPRHDRQGRWKYKNAGALFCGPPGTAEIQKCRSTFLWIAKEGGNPGNAGCGFQERFVLNIAALAHPCARGIRFVLNVKRGGRFRAFPVKLQRR
ncbi:hypothetical protein [Marinobacterium rhizophilum]|uniref:Uncharacterized protein n=1 Tax=Marinobacterium rhizophilum TaxID=420402 RepID=A0ABY5HDV9_9GAMM|nr:hypothetical protein [Marinobacterium rhizophilum]UTW10531.1 hypothetical protein KDW95_14665 [Marinobacterium rhizophilum]